jgi:hypothetical protein
LRQAVAQRIHAAGRQFIGLWLEAPLPVLEQRVAGRRDDASDADLAVLRAAARITPGPLSWRRLDATDIDILVATAKQLLCTDSLVTRSRYKTSIKTPYHFKH